MVSDSELIARLQEFLKNSDLNTTTTGIVRRQLEKDFGVDLTDKKIFIREQVDLFLQSQFENDQNDGGNEEQQQEDDGEDDQMAKVKSDETDGSDDAAVEEGDDDNNDENDNDDEANEAKGPAKRRLVIDNLLSCHMHINFNLLVKCYCTFCIYWFLASSVTRQSC